MEINISLTGQGVDKAIDNAIAKVEAYAKKLNDRARMFTEYLAQYCKNRIEAELGKVASERYTVTVAAKGNNTYFITAQSKEICFLEFGTGVIYNGNESYPQVAYRSSVGVVGIGQYDFGNGKKQAWGYYGEPNRWTLYSKELANGETLVITGGIPSQHFMYDTIIEVWSDAERLAKEFFK